MRKQGDRARSLHFEKPAASVSSGAEARDRTHDEDAGPGARHG
jgi:hypothetical protein